MWELCKLKQHLYNILDAHFSQLYKLEFRK